MALPRRIHARHGLPPSTRHLRRAQGTDRQVRSAGDSGRPCPRDRRIKRKAISRQVSSPSAPKAPAFELNDHNGKLISSTRSVKPRSPGDLLFPRTLVPFLRRTAGSHESDPAPDRAGRSITGRNLPADSSTVILHGGPAQVALSIVERCWKQGRPPVRARLSRAPRSSKLFTAGPSSTCLSRTGTTVGNCPSPPLSSSTATAPCFTPRPDEDYTERPEPAEDTSAS